MAEVLVAIAILSVGLVSVAALLGRVLADTSRSEYMTQAATLASEKLEDLNRYPADDPDVAVTNGSTAGSLSSDLVQNVTSNGTTESVSYYDEVFFSPTQGFVEETISGVDASGNPAYTTTTHGPDGSVTSTTSATPGSNSLTIGFKRRWIIEKDSPIAGLRRITVLVTLENLSVRPPVTFQMSMVRP